MRRILLLCVLVLMLVGCRKDDVAPSVRHKIIAIASYDGIGDQGYLDRIAQGFETVYASINPDETFMRIYTPHSNDEACSITMNTIKYACDGVPTLIILGGSVYKDLVETIAADSSIFGNNISILLFECTGIAPAVNNLKYHTFVISAKQACYEAGRYVAESGYEHPLVWLATSQDRQLDGFRDGFSDGYFDVAGRRPDVRYLSNDWDGYSMSDSAYRSMPELSKRYDFLFPVMSGSNLGVFRYLREHPDGPSVAGMDVDQSKYASKVVGSLLKNVDRAVVDFVSAWMAGERLPAHSDFDASSGYVEWYVAP